MLEEVLQAHLKISIIHIDLVYHSKCFFQSAVCQHDRFAWLLQYFVVENTQVELSPQPQRVGWREVVLYQCVSLSVQLQSSLDDVGALICLEKFRQIPCLSNQLGANYLI